MRRLLASFVALLVCLTPTFSFAESADENTSQSASPGLITGSIAEALLAAAQQQVGGADRTDWQMRMDAAQARRGRGVRLVFVGLGVSAGGSVLAATAGPDTIFDDGNSGLQSVGILTALAGAGVFWYGVYHWLSGSNDVDDLDREGRTNGFLSLAPTNGGVQVAWNLSF